MQTFKQNFMRTKNGKLFLDMIKGQTPISTCKTDSTVKSCSECAYFSYCQLAQDIKKKCGNSATRIQDHLFMILPIKCLFVN